MADDPPPAITLRYSANRGEIWTWYWREWRRKLWPRWLLAGAAMAGAVLALAFQRHRLGAEDFAGATTAVAALWSFFAIYPQLSFKREERTLIVGPGGLETTIGKKSGRRNWREIGAVTDTGTHVVFAVAKTGNAFLVPYRAFAGDAERSEFLRRVAIWRDASREPSRI